MSNLTSTLVGQSVTIVMGDPWDLGESISWKPLHCVVLREGVRPASGFGPAREAILLRLKEPFTFDDVRYEYLQGSPRYVGSSLGDLRKDGTEVHCGFAQIPPDRLDEQPPLDLSWWRGGGGLIGALSLD